MIRANVITKSSLIRIWVSRPETGQINCEHFQDKFRYDDVNLATEAQLDAMIASRL